MSKVLGLDLGDRRIGVAVADRDSRVVLPIATLPNNREIISALNRLKAELGFDRIVVGWPITTSGQAGEQAAKVKHLAEKIERLVLVPVEFQDERFSSHEAAGRLVADHGPAGLIDEISAVIILESWLGAGKG